MDIIPVARRETFVRTVFGNILDVHSVNSRLAEALTRRQQSSAVVNRVGDIFLEYIPHFEPFIRYGANQLWGKYEFEKEKSSNPSFARWVDDVERKPESRKLELNGYLTKPTTRLARYPLLLEAICNHSAEDNQDKTDLPKAVALIREFLARVNVESGKAENTFNLQNLGQQLSNKPGEPHFDLRLAEEGRQLVFKGPLARRANTNASNADADLLQLFLFDHLLVVVKIKVVNKHEEYRIYKKVLSHKDQADAAHSVGVVDFDCRGGRLG
jgi:RHO1 GDP-GTP exchange protein 1/2